MIIVWIDDDSYRTKTTKELLEMQGHKIHFFAEYAEGYDYLKSNHMKTGAVILDIMMPPGEFFNPKETNDGRTTGLHLFKLIRKFFRGPILLYTIFGNQAQIEYFIRNDAKARYLAKPAGDDEIMSCIYQMK